MKQILSLFVVLMFVLSVTGVAFAQDTTNDSSTGTTVDANTATEVSDATTEVQTDTSVETTTDTEVSTDTETTVEDNATVTETQTTSEIEATNEAETTEVEVQTEETTPTDTQVEAEVETELQADANGEVGNVTQTEVETMTDVSGAKVRLLQLQERIERNIAHGEDVIAELSGNNSSVDTLQGILDQLSDLKDQVAAIDPSASSIQDATAQFVAIKLEAIKLSKQFRTEARKLVKANKIAALKDKIKAKDAERLSNIREKVKNAKDARNARVLSEILARLGESNPELVQQLQSGEITVAEAKAQIAEAFRALSSDKKNTARLKLKEKVSEDRVKGLQIRQNLKAKGKAKVADLKDKLRSKAKNSRNKSDNESDN